MVQAYDFLVESIHLGATYDCEKVSARPPCQRMNDAGWRARGGSHVLSYMRSKITIGLHQRPNVKQTPCPGRGTVTRGRRQLERKSVSWILRCTVGAHVDIAVETHVTCKSPGLLDQEYTWECPSQ